jgi:hypothetical protein
MALPFVSMSEYICQTSIVSVNGDQNKRPSCEEAAYPSDPYRVVNRLQVNSSLIEHP